MAGNVERPSRLPRLKEYVIPKEPRTPGGKKVVWKWTTIRLKSKCSRDMETRRYKSGGEKGHFHWIALRGRLRTTRREMRPLAGLKLPEY